MHPILLKLGSFEIHSFSVMMVVAFLAALGVLQWRAGRYGLTKDQVADVAFWALISGVLGARIVFILQDLPYYLHNLKELFSLQFEGLTSFGGLIFGFLAVVIWARKKHVPLGKVLDLCAPAFVIGHAIGRIGCLLNGCCFGPVCPADFPFGVHVEGGGAVLHYPAQAADTVMNLAVFGILIWRARKGLGWGQLTGLALILHGTTRVIYEFWRAGTVDQVNKNLASSTYWGNLPFTQAQAMAAFLVLVGFVIFFTSGRKAVAKTEVVPA
jgi:phosphatidylglycerol:prolipoprotein diacylglycerol transferase